MIQLFTDYGLEGPYLGQVQAVLHTLAPDSPVINLLADAPRHNPKASAYLLASLVSQIPKNTVVFCVVDPGVGTGEDRPLVIKVDGRYFVGPDNGLFDLVCRYANEIDVFQITWKPEKLSSSFHGRDLYAPVCAKIINGEKDYGNVIDWHDRHKWPDDLHEIIYIDHFGNCMTGVRQNQVTEHDEIEIHGERVKYSTTFGDVKSGTSFLVYKIQTGWLKSRSIREMPVTR